MIITSLAKLVTAIAFEAIDYWFESNKMLWLSIIFNLSTTNFRLIKFADTKNCFLI